MPSRPTHQDHSPRAWADLVYHVLAHVRGTAQLSASVFDPCYVAFVRQHAGPAESRPLGEDVAILARAAHEHQSLARIQLLAWLHDDVDQALSCAGRELGDLREDEVERPAVLESLRQIPAAEVLRCSALLESAAWERLPVADFDRARCEQDLRSLADVAPALPHCRIAWIPSLRLRGRVLGREILVGVPDEQRGPSFSHVAWQAAHEASVLEVGARALQSGARLGHDRLEHCAVVLLARRAQSRGRRAERDAWYAHFGPRAPSAERAALDDEAAAIVDDCFTKPNAGRRW